MPMGVKWLLKDGVVLFEDFTQKYIHTLHVQIIVCTSALVVYQDYLQLPPEIYYLAAALSSYVCE